MEIYNKENLKEMGYIYSGLLHVLKLNMKNPYPNAEMLPYKSIFLILPEAMVLGLPKELNDRVKKFMIDFFTKDVDNLMRCLVPEELRKWWFEGFDNYK